MTDIKKRPYDFVRSYYEEEFPRVGWKIFSILSLVPISLIIPKIPSQVKETKQKISLFWISPSGSAKTSVAEEFEKIAINPISTSKITPARLYFEIKKREGKKTTLICPDVSIMFSDEELIKLLEGYLGEESTIFRSTMRNVGEPLGIKVDGSAYLSGTPKIISDNRIRDGLLGRASPIITFFDEGDNQKIIDKINSRIGKEIEKKGWEKISEFYKGLYEIQEGASKEITPIDGYIISDDIKHQIGEYVKNLPYLGVILSRWGIHSARALEETYRFLISHAFLNIYNRDVKDRKLVITQEDCEIAKRLIKFESQETYKILKAVEVIDWFNIRNEREFRVWNLKMEKDKQKVPQDIRLMIHEMVK